MTRVKRCAGFSGRKGFCWELRRSPNLGKKPKILGYERKKFVIRGPTDYPNRRRDKLTQAISVLKKNGGRERSIGKSCLGRTST